MSVLKVNQIKAKLRSMFEPYLDLKDVPAHDQERDSKILTRCLAAFAIYVEAGCGEKEAAGAVWDGSDDNGIDAAYYDASDSRVLFVQSKWIQKGTGEPAANEILTFTKGVRDAIENDYGGFHARLHPRLSDIGLRLNQPGTRVHCVVISTGASVLAKHGTGRLADLLAELNGADADPIASSRVMGLSEVYFDLANDPLQGSPTLEANILEWSIISAPYQAYFGIIDGLTVRDWWKKHGKRVVNSNIRHSLGATEVNNEIKNTALHTPERFWYFNNGITLVAEDAVKAPAGAASRSAGLFSFKGASIVNGAQTVSTLARVESEEALGRVRVPIRVVLLKAAPSGFGGEVTRTNNLQNRVEPRDFVAQDPEQRRLRQEMAIEGIDYQFVRSEDANTARDSCELIEVTTALACASGDPGLAVQVKTGISRFFADLQKAPYKSIFNASLSGAGAFNAVLVQRRIDNWILFERLTIAKKSGPPWGVLIHGNRILAAAVFRKLGISLSEPIAAFRVSMKNSREKQIADLCEDVYSRMVRMIQAEFPGKFLAVLFKNLTNSKRVFDAAVS